MSDAPDPRARFAAALARLRAAAGCNQHALAARASVSPIELSRMERGLRTPTLPTLCRLADALGVSLDELCGR